MKKKNLTPASKAIGEAFLQHLSRERTHAAKLSPAKRYEQSKKIAAFMNLTLVEDPFETFWKAEKNGRPDITPQELAVHHLSYDLGSKALLFPESWDWLMPVLETIEAFGLEIFLHGHRCHITWLGLIVPENEALLKVFADNDIEREGATKIEAAFAAAVAFVEWHEQAKKEVVHG